MKKKLLLIGAIAWLILTNNSLLFSQNLYTQIGTDPSWSSIISNHLIPIGTNSTAGIKGSTINVNNAVVENVTYGGNNIPTSINIHTVGNSAVGRADFPKWTRWYQEDGNTQVFRLFKGEYNVRNTRENAARIESFSNLNWKFGDGWQEWVGTYTIVKPVGGSIFQVKNPDNDWAVMITMSGNGDITYQPRGGTYKKIASNMTGKSFDLRVRDNGRDYEVYLNGGLVGTGSYNRPTSTTAFRWGMYVGNSLPANDGLIFVTGAAVNPTSTPVKKAQSISFATLLPRTLDETDFNAGANASSGLPVSYSSSNTSVATIVNGFIHLVGPGTSIITASQAGNALYNAATSVSQTLTVNNVVSINHAPVVSFTKPLQNASFTAPATLVISVSASDSDAGDLVENVQLYMNNVPVRTEVVPPYDWNHIGQDPTLQNLSAGSYTFKAVAKDSKGLTGETSITVLVKSSTDPCAGTNAPTINLSSPLQNSTFDEGQTIVFTTLVSPSVVKVEFYNGTNLLGTDNATPFNFSTSTLSAGTYTFSAKGYDNCGKNAASSPILVVVKKVVVNSDPILGSTCGKTGQSITFTINTANRTNATGYKWWFSGAAATVTPSTDGFSATVVPGQYFTSGQVCVGVNLSKAPYYTSYCKPVNICSARFGEEEGATTSIEESLRIYPNPSSLSQNIVIDASVFQVAPSKVAVVNALGESVLETSNTALQTTLSTSSLNAGSYTVKITFEDQTITRRLLIVK